ncbi:MAG: FHA domain-containing protein, partial [Deltaproteobacteria bacterium]|nr:FHA domain-containing protein [Deltaproteobacteria bacterium]
MAPPAEDDHTIVSQPQEEYPCLELLGGGGVSGRFPLHPGSNLVGRLSDSDIVLDDSSVSRKHATIQISGDVITLIDHGGRNGTLVQGQKVQAGVEIPLDHEFRIRIGAYSFRLLKRAAAPVSAGGPAATPPQNQEELPEVPPEEAPPSEEEMQEEIPQQEVAVPRKRRLFLILLLVLGVVVIGLGGWSLYNRLGSKKRPDRKAERKEKIEKPAEGEGGEALPVIGGGEEQPDGAEIRPVFLAFSSPQMPVRVFFGEKEVGKTPFRISSTLESGKWYEAKALFELSEVGETVEETAKFQVTPGVELIPISFSAPIGVFKVANLPRDAELYLEGYFEKDPTRPKPIKFSEVVFGKPVYIPYGQYVLELRQSRQLEGSQTFVDKMIYRREFLINTEKTNYTIEVKETDLPFFPVEIVSVPTGAKVLIDSKEVGVTPFQGMFPLGEHLLVLKRDGYNDHSQLIKMEVNTAFVSEIKLVTSEAGESINRATELIKGDRPGEALPILVEAFNKKPTERESAEISYLVGICYLRQNAFQESEDHFKKAMVHPDFKSHGRLGLANLTYQKGDPVKALQLLIDVLINAEDAAVRSNAGILFQQLSPLKSVLYITSDPEGALVFVNSQEMPRKTPLILHDLSV